MAGSSPRIIFNNDGGDGRRSLSELNDPMDFLDIRTTPLAGTHVDVISYCSCIGFGMFKHDSKVGSIVPVATDRGKSALHALIEQGTDPLRVMVEYGHAHDMKVFWSMRMNDTHDGNLGKNGWMFEGNRFKVENPDCLMGPQNTKPRCGKWSAVDYANPKVRDMALAFVEEVCTGYDVDGVELDFFRHPVLFRSTSAGLSVTDEERELMTDLIRAIAALLKRVGDQRGRPFTLAVRTPDDIDYAATIGLDVEAWMRDGLIDMYIPSGYFRLRSWRYAVELGQRYGVQVYAGFSETRVGGGHHKHGLRAADECYRARAANAWQAGVDGIYMFNLFDPHRRVWSELGDPETLRRLDKLYFASVRGARKAAGGGAYPSRGYLRIPMLNPGAPVPLPPEGLPEVVRIEMAEDMADVPVDAQPAMSLTVQLGVVGEMDAVPEVSREEVGVVFNGHRVAAAPSGNSWCGPLDPRWVRPGWNAVQVQYCGSRDDVQLADVIVAVDYSGELLADTAYLDTTRAKM